MAELLFSSRRPNNYAGSGRRRVYANLNDFHSDVQTHGWEAKPVAFKARFQRGNGNQAGSDIGPHQAEERRRRWNESKRAGVQSPDDGLREEFVEYRRESGKHASGKGPVGGSNRGQDHEKEIISTHVNGKGASCVQDEARRAAALLLERTADFLFVDLCESCSATLRCRLTSIASGEISGSLSTDSSSILAAESPDEHRNSGGLNGISDAKFPDTDEAHLADTNYSENGVDDHDDETESSHAEIVAENAGKHEVVLKKDDGRVYAPRQEPNGERRRAGSNHITTNLMFKTALRSIQDAPAYRTRSMSRQAGLLQTPDEISESAGDSREDARILEVKRKKDFSFFERVDGQNINILEGLELHANVFNPVEQKELIDFVYELQELGRNQKLRRRTYSEPRKWMRGKGRVTIQFGCCYNYAVDKEGNPPGILREEEVDEIPPKLRMVIKRLVQWQVLPSSCIPDSCIVNIYDVGDCIPPHIDHHDFVRPFCTLSLLSECDIVFGTNLRIAGPGEFKGSTSIPLPTGSVLILSGNGADISKHAVPAVPSPRISITFRKMDPTKVPHAFRPDIELLSTQPLTNASHSKLRMPVTVSNSPDESHHRRRTSDLSQFSLDSDFPALGRPVPSGRHRNLRS